MDYLMTPTWVLAIGPILILAAITIIGLNCVAFADHEEEKPVKDVKIHIYKCY